MKIQIGMFIKFLFKLKQYLSDTYFFVKLDIVLKLTIYINFKTAK